MPLRRKVCRLPRLIHWNTGRGLMTGPSAAEVAPIADQFASWNGLFQTLIACDSLRVEVTIKLEIHALVEALIASEGGSD